MKNFLKNLFGSQNKPKTSLPDEYQVKMVLGEFNKEQLVEIADRYILQSHHLNLMGNAFRNMNEFSLAEKAFLDAIELSPEYDEPYGNLLSLYIAQEKYDLCEAIYKKGMKNATSKSFIMYQDGRLAFIKGNYEQSLMAARCILIDEKMQDEPAFVLGVHSLLSLVKQQKDVDKNIDEAFQMWQRGIIVFPESVELLELKKYFDDSE